MEASVSKHKRAISDLFASKKLNDENFDGQLKAPIQQKMVRIHDFSVKNHLSCFEPDKFFVPPMVTPRAMDMEELSACFEAQKKQPHDTNVQNSLKQEILQLQEQLQSEFVTRHALEKAISFRPFSLDLAAENSIPKAVTELIKQIAVLELEVVYLEKYLLSLYRRTFKHQKSSFSDHMEGESSVHSDHMVSPQNSIGNQPKERNEVGQPQKLLHSCIRRSYSSLWQRSAGSSRNCPLSNSVARAIDSYHSLPLSMLEQSQGDTSTSVSLGEHFGTCIHDRAHESPNWLSEEMLKSISAIYCELAEPPLTNHNNPSPISSSLSVYELSSQDFGSMRNYEKFSSFNSHFDNPFHIVNSEDFSGPYCTMMKVQWISRERKKDADVNRMLQSFRSLIYRLKGVDLKDMKHEEKLAFWINVQNTLVMHAYLQYGIPKNSLKKISLLRKAAYNVGGHIISIDMIRSSILGCRLPRSGQWLRLLFASKTKFKFNDALKAFAIDHPEPRLYFALCCGSHSDPAVRLYTPKGVYKELEVAKEDYILSNFSIHEGRKILLPKIVGSFAKDSGLCLDDLVEMVDHLKPDGELNNIQQCQHKKIWKSIGWIPHNFTFSFLLSKELACQSMS